MPVRIACALIGFLMAASAARADYPVSGKWSYDNPSGPPAAACGTRTMEFLGQRRIDKGGGVPEYRNVSVAGTAPSYRVVDEFFTVQIRGRMAYTLRMIDDDHIEIVSERSGRIRLRRCGS
jgi:hypothetical protein